MTRIQMETIFNVDSMNQEHSSDVRSISNNKIYHSEYTETWLKIIRLIIYNQNLRKLLKCIFTYSLSKR